MNDLKDRVSKHKDKVMFYIHTFFAYQIGFSAVLTGARKSHLTLCMTSCHSAVTNEVVNSYTTIKNMLTFIFFGNSLYNFIWYARETLIHWLPAKNMKSGSWVTV